jgi:hypothetical protein
MNNAPAFHDDCCAYQNLRFDVYLNCTTLTNTGISHAEKIINLLLIPIGDDKEASNKVIVAGSPVARYQYGFQ